MVRVMVRVRVRIMVRVRVRCRQEDFPTGAPQAIGGLPQLQRGQSQMMVWVRVTAMEDDSGVGADDGVREGECGYG